MAQKYIVGDLVKVWIDLEIGYQVAEVAGRNPYIPEYILTNWFIEDTIGVISVAEDRIMPIPLTSEILQKNGWDKERIYFTHSRIPRIKLCTDSSESKWSVSINGDIMGGYINYVHELQHILFAFKIYLEMEV